MKPQDGNGSGKFEIVQQDLGGWLRVCAGKGPQPDDLPFFLSTALTDWFRQHPHLRMRCVVPVQRDGNTVELHVWYERHVFPPNPGMTPTPQD